MIKKNTIKKYTCIIQSMIIWTYLKIEIIFWGYLECLTCGRRLKYVVPLQMLDPLDLLQRLDPLYPLQGLCCAVDLWCF